MADVPFAFIRDMMAAALGVEAHLLRPPYKDAQEFDYRLSRILRADFDYKDIFSASAMHGLEEGTVYYVHNTLELNYVFMPVPGPKPRSVLLFGPFLYEAASGPFFERVLAQNRIGKGDAAALRTFYGTVPEVAEPTMAAAAHAVACQLYGAHDPARVVHRTLASTVTGRAQPDEAFQFSMELLERRYRDENALLAAVSRGDYDAAVRHLGRFSIKNFTPRTGELLRDVKNMLIVVNTLLRKAAESGGVHPVYIDLLSGALAGLAGGMEIAGLYGRFVDEFGAGATFNGLLASRLVSNAMPLIPASAFVLAALQAGAYGVERACGIPRNFIDCFTTIIIMLITMEGFYDTVVGGCGKLIRRMTRKDKKTEKEVRAS